MSPALVLKVSWASFWLTWMVTGCLTGFTFTGSEYVCRGGPPAGRFTSTRVPAPVPAPTKLMVTVPPPADEYACPPTGLTGAVELAGCHETLP